MKRGEHRVAETTATHYVVSTAKSVPEALSAVEKSLASRQFGVLWHLDINEKLTEKGLGPVAPFHVLEVCSAPRARQALTTTQEVGYFLPCKVVVYQTADQQTRIGLLRPRLMTDLLGDERLRPLAEEVEGILTAAIEEAAN